MFKHYFPFDMLDILTRLDGTISNGMQIQQTQQCPNMDVIKLKVAVVLMIPLIDFSNKTFDFLSLHSMIETVEQNRDGFLKEVFHEYRSFSNFDIYDSKTTSFSVKLGCYENDGMFMLINASSGLSSDLS
ncbi:unnamed protein product [Schistosoma bovis]|nr:unnamed protein product [Schistosoma bovis]